MAVKIRLFRVGKKKNPMYRIVVTDSRKGTRGSYIEKIGFFNPISEPAEVTIDKEKALEWMRKGALPSKTVHNLFRDAGIALEYHLERSKADEKTRQIELQKWELKKKETEEKSRIEQDEKLKKQAEEETVDEPVVEPEANEPAAEEAEEKSEEKSKE